MVSSKSSKQARVVEAKAKQMKETLLQRRYEIILFPNYFITVVYYYRTDPILFFLLFSVPTFLSFSKFFHYWFLLLLYGISNSISDPTLYFYLQCYSLDSTIVVSRITLIMCSFLVQRINLS